MSSKEDNPSLARYYSMEKFIKELKKISGIPDSLSLDDLPSNTTTQPTGYGNYGFSSPYYKNRAEPKQKNIKVNFANNDLNQNESMKQEMTKLRKENAELKFCLNNVNKKFENEIKQMETNMMVNLKII